MTLRGAMKEGEEEGEEEEEERDRSCPAQRGRRYG
jgi:hypothetical protein